MTARASMATPSPLTLPSRAATAIAVRPRATLIVLCTAVFMAALDMFIVNVAMTSIGSDYGDRSLANLSWILNGYTIIYGALLVPAGRLADRFGKKQGFLAGLALFTIASIACASAPDLWSLVVFRGLQAAGGALLTPASLGLVLTVLPEATRSRSVRIWTASGALAGAAGPVVGGLLIGWSWRWIFLVNVPIGIAAMIATMRLVPATPREPTGRWPDLLGGAILAIAIGALVLGLVEVPARGWHAPLTSVCWAVAVAGFAVFIRRSARHPNPIVDMTMLRQREFAWSNVAMLLISAAFAIQLVSIVLLMQEGWRWSTMKTGFAIVPGPLMVPVFALIGQRLATTMRIGVVAALGCATIAISALLFLTIGQDSYLTGTLPAWMVGGIGVGLTFPSIFAAATVVLPPERASTGSAVVNMSRQVGLALGTSVVVVLAGLAAGAANPLAHGWWFAMAIAIVAALAALRITPRTYAQTWMLVEDLLDEPAP